MTLPTGSRSELRNVVSSQLQILLEQKNYEGAKALLIPVQPVDIAEAIALLPEAMQAIAFRLLDKAKAIEVYEYLHFEVQQFLLEKFQAEEALQIIDSISPDERVKLFDELPPKIVRRLISQLSPEERQATSLLLGYQADTAGRLMTPEYIALKEDLTATEAGEQIRSLASSVEVSYYIYVVDSGKKLIGITSLKDLILAAAEQTLGEIMTRDVVYAYTDTDQEEVARLIQRYDLLA
ncbi:MAG: magnesium transporter, partial [Xenococcaceae cyanobacterium MO_234.B1]|nr:magnesium transporter [Xenococcaceae cyanobacterium MO_234.B1]